MFKILKCLSLLVLSSKINAQNETNVVVKFSRDHYNSNFSQSYPEFIKQTNTLVDKTLLIKRLLEDPSKLILIAYPHLFCKTFNLGMLKTFLEIETDFGQPLPRELSANYRWFTSGNLLIHRDEFDEPESQKLIRPLLISNETKIIDQYLARYPTINVTFQVKPYELKTYDEIFDLFRNRISLAFKEHSYMKSTLQRKLRVENNPEQKQQIELDLQLFSSFENADANGTMLNTSLSFLSKLLRGYFDKKVFIFIDDYDEIINRTLAIHPPVDEDIEDMIKFYKSFVQDAVHNEHVQKAFLSGVLQIAKKILGLDAKTYNMVENQLHPFYGFIDKEIDSLAYWSGITFRGRKRMAFWYAYHLGKNNEITIYSPGDIVLSISAKRAENYRAFLVRTHIDQWLLWRDKPLVKDLLSIMRNATIRINHNHMEYDVASFQNMYRALYAANTTAEIRETILCYLVSTGCLKFSKGTYYDPNSPYAYVEHGNLETQNALAHYYLMYEMVVNKVPYQRQMHREYTLSYDY